MGGSEGAAVVRALEAIDCSDPRPRPRAGRAARTMSTVPPVDLPLASTRRSPTRLRKGSRRCWTRRRSFWGRRSRSSRPLMCPSSAPSTASGSPMGPTRWSWPAGGRCRRRHRGPAPGQHLHRHRAGGAARRGEARPGRRRTRFLSAGCSLAVARITKKTRFLMPVHLYGQMAPIETAGRAGPGARVDRSSRTPPRRKGPCRHGRAAGTCGGWPAGTSFYQK